MVLIVLDALLLVWVQGLGGRCLSRPALFFMSEASRRPPARSLRPRGAARGNVPRSRRADAAPRYSSRRIVSTSWRVIRRIRSHS